MLNRNSSITQLVGFALVLSLIFVNVANAPEVFPRNAVQLGKAASRLATPSPSAAPASTPTTPTSSSPSSSSKPALPKIKITSPTRDQQVQVAKDLTVSGTSIDNATSNCQVSVRVNKVRPYQPVAATAAGTGGAADYSKWSFVLTSKYTTIKPGDNRITAKYQCANNPALTSFSTVSVIGVPAMISVNKAQSTTTLAARQAANVTNQISHKPQTTITTPTAATLQRPLPQLPESTNNNNTSGSSSLTATSSIPIVVKPLAGGICTQGYHLVSGSVCIKDINTPTKTTSSATPTSQLPRTMSVPSSTTNQPNTSSPNNDKDSADSNSEENFNTKILKSFNKQFKDQNK
jgi:hypothetical protein